MAERIKSQLPSLPYDAVIATRNRAEALALSIPLLLEQSCPPSRLIVIDSSDDHAAVAETVRAVTADWSGEVIVEASARGTAYQRNLGLGHVTAPVVLFPDDDSLLYPDTAAEILAVYARDSDAQIAAVCAAEAMTPPAASGLQSSYSISEGEAGRRRWRHVRFWMDRHLVCLAPLKHLGQRLNDRHATPDWLEEMNVVPVEYMTGFRMSFRTDAIRAVGFDNTLRNYAICEDIDASLGVARLGMVVAASRARIYHHRFPGARADGRTLGLTEALNQIYVLLKHSQSNTLGAAAARTLRLNGRAFVLLKFLRNLKAATTPFGRARLSGIFSFLRLSGPMWRASGDDLSARYRDVLGQGLKE